MKYISREDIREYKDYLILGKEKGYPILFICNYFKLVNKNCVSCTYKNNLGICLFHKKPLETLYKLFPSLLLEEEYIK